MNIKINNKKISALKGQTILEVARANKIKIPSLCYHPDLDVRAGCRVCVVEVKGRDKLCTACSTAILEGMEIFTDSERVIKSRSLNVEMLFASHAEKCVDCTLRFNCTLLDLARDYNLKIARFSDRKINRKTYKFANAVEIDGTQCIDCSNCISACDKQGISFLKMEGNGCNQEVKQNKDNHSACIYCGQCANVCPVAAAQEQGEWKQVEADLKDNKKIVVAQFAPAVRVSLGEEFGMPYGVNCTKKINTALKILGFSHVFDVNFGADITTMTEAEELVERLNNKKAVFPMTTSCCPAWVAYAESYHPELLPNLTTARSPHIHSAGAIKSYFAKKNKIDAKKIIVVSIVPCTSKKYEAARPELKYEGRPLVDHVLTTREFAFILKKNKIDFKNLADSETDPIFNDGSGAAAIYGASGGVMESALRSAISMACKGSKNKLCSSRLEFKEVRGLKGLKEASVNLAGHKLKIAVVNGIGHFEQLLPKLNQYHYIEVMACPGGCLGGGGQPMPTTDVIRKQRLEGMYKIDSGKSVRRAHENRQMTEYYDWVKKNKLSAKLLHTKFSAKKR
jgi:iron-only hydrogenase group A